MEILKKEYTEKYKEIHYYTAYGANIKSEIEIREFISRNYLDTKSIDINIYYGNIPTYVDEMMSEGHGAQYNKDEVWFYVKQTGVFYINSGSEIFVREDDGCDFNKLKAFLIWRAIGICLLQKNIISFHGAAIEIDKKAIIFSGESGSGKSTLAAQFYKNNYSLISDELCVTKILCDGSIVLNPGYPQQRLSREAIDMLGYNYKDFIRNSSTDEMYAVPTRNLFFYNETKLDVIIEITVNPEINRVVIDELTGLEKIKIITNNIYMNSYVRYIVPNNFFQKKCIEIAKSVRVFKLQRPVDKFTVKEQMDLIISRL